MKPLQPFLLAALACLSTLAHPQAALPADVARYVEERDLCEHFLGEEPYDAERRKFLEKSVNQYCTGTDRKLKALKLKYKDQPQVLSRLNGYEPGIEGATK